MASGWTKFEIKVPDIPSGDLTDIINKIKEFIQVIVSILETLLSIIAAITDPLASAIKAIINAIKEAIESFLEDLGGYLLFVPIRKRLMTNFLGLGDVTPQFASDWGVFGQPESQLDPNNPALNEFLTNMNRYNGGNFGFFRTVYDSLNDEGDINRPQFTSDSDWVGGLVILMGTDLDVFGFLDDIWKLFGLFHAPNDGMVAIPRPVNLKARAISRVLGGKFSVLLNWEQVPNPFVHLEDLGDAYCYPERYAIIRVKNDVRAYAAQSVVDLMGSRALEQGMIFSGGDAVVIKEDELNVTNVSYIDSDIPAAEDDAFYYAMAWKVKLYKNITMSEEDAVELDYWYISNVVQVVPFPTLPTATPPNWVRTPSIASLFPPLADLLRKFVMYLENFADKILGVTDLLQQYVDFLKSEIARYEAIINRILDEIAKIKVMFDMPTAGIYMRTFKGKGGNIFFQTDLLQSLMPGYENAPPFGRGDEYVTGVILMTGGYKPEVEAFITGLELFFSGEGGVSQLVDQLGEQVDSLEDLMFGEDLQPTDEKTAVEFDRSLCPLNTCCNPPADPIVPTFGGNFSVK